MHELQCDLKTKLVTELFAETDIRATSHLRIKCEQPLITNNLFSSFRKYNALSLNTEEKNRGAQVEKLALSQL